jgi:hypothetical protein
MKIRFVIEPDGCWSWQGHCDPLGYGRWAGKLAHRLIWESLNGPIPEGLELDHLCRNRRCVNPAHLEPVTHAENMRRSAPATKTHCINGHPYDEANTYIRPTGQRDCRLCTAARQRAYQARGKAA